MRWAVATTWNAAVTADGGGAGVGFDPIAFISQPIVVQTGATGILVFVILSILRGWLVPRAVLLDRMKDKDEIIARQDVEIIAWREAHRISEAGREELKSQHGKLISSQENMNRFVDEFHRYFGQNHPEPQTLRQIEGGHDGP